MARKKSSQQVAAEVSIAKTHYIAQTVTNVVGSIAKWGTLLAIAYLFAPVLQVAVEAMAGKETIAKLSMEWLLNEHAANLLAFAFGGGGMAYGYKQSKLRGDAIERLHAYQKKYEEEIDPNRTSSGLTPRGKTRKEDV